MAYGLKPTRFFFLTKQLQDAFQRVSDESAQQKEALHALKQKESKATNMVTELTAVSLGEPEITFPSRQRLLLVNQSLRDDENWQMNNSPHACLRHTSKFHPQASFSHCKVAKFCINEFLRLNRIPTHRECNCEEFCLQARPDWDVTKTGNGKMKNENKA